MKVLIGFISVIILIIVFLFQPVTHTPMSDEYVNTVTVTHKALGSKRNHYIFMSSGYKYIAKYYNYENVKVGDTLKIYHKKYKVSHPWIGHFRDQSYLNFYKDGKLVLSDQI